MNIDRRLVADFQLHPLGFYYLILVSGPITSRLHVYLESSTSKAKNDWHTHEFDLRSKVITGSLNNEIGSFIIGGNEFADEYLVEYCDNKSSLRATGRKGEVRRMASFSTISGSEYSIRAGVIHRAWALTIPCVTHVEMSHTGGDIYSYGGDEAPFIRRKVTHQEAAEILSILESVGLISPN